MIPLSTILAAALVAIATGLLFGLWVWLMLGLLDWLSSPPPPKRPRSYRVLRTANPVAGQPPILKAYWS